MTAGSTLLIGVDGGATEAKAHAVACDNLERPTSFELRPESASRVYPRVADFAPVPVTEQFAQRDAGNIELSASETEQGRLFVGAAAEAIVDVARQCSAKRVLAGMGMPGLKTPDGRGIHVINNGPRMPDYLDALEAKLTATGIELVSPIAALGSDADYCGLGEQYAAAGLFRDVENAYYVGCGTGIADAMKLRGKLVPFDGAKSWLMKSWQMPSALGPTFEKLVSAKSLNAVYAALRGAREGAVAAGASPAVDDALGGETKEAVAAALRGGRGMEDTPRYPEHAAATGHPIAAAWMDTVALVMAELIFERLRTFRNGRPNAPHRGDAYARLNPDHEYRGVLLDRVVIGQRVGMIYANEAYRNVFGKKLDTYLAELIAGSNDAEMTTALLSGERRTLQTGFLQASKLRAAPALGAAVAAVRAICR